MDKFAFAELISYITAMGSRAISEHECREIEALMNRCNFQRSSQAVDDLLRLMGSNSKIEAIKAYRALTGQGLKESKDAVEKYWIARPAENAA